MTPGQRMFPLAALAATRARLLADYAYAVRVALGERPDRDELAEALYREDGGEA